MESLAKAVAVMGLTLMGIGVVIGCLVGWGVSSWFDLSKAWSISIGGVLGAPMGFFSLVLFGRLSGKNKSPSSEETHPDNKI